MEFMVLVYVLIMIAFAKAIGEIVSRVDQPPIVGELLAGIVLGPFVLGLVFTDLGKMYDSTFISDLGDLGMLFLMLYVGLEFSPRLISASSWKGVAIAAGGVAVPIACGLLLSVLFDFRGLTLAFVAVAMSVTALPVTIRILKDMEVLNTPTSSTIISAALVTDVGLLFALGVILGTSKGEGSANTALYLTFSFVLFFALALLVAKVFVPHIYKLLLWMRTGEAAFAVAVGIAILFAIFAEWAGLPGVVGAFIAGMLLRETGKGLRVWTRVEDILSGVTLGFLAPIFFVLIGFNVEFDSIAGYLPLFSVVAGLAIVGKLVGSYVPSRMLRIGKNESLAIGSMMMGKGAMELVFARLALEEGLIEPYLFSVLVLMAFASTVLAPIMFRTFYNRAVVSGEISSSVRKTEPPELSDASQYA